MALLQNVIARGTHAARPAAGSAGVLYWETDTLSLFRDNGTSWDLQFGPMVASGGSHAAGLVPDPGSSAGTTHFLREDATWAVPPGGSAALTQLADTTISGSSAASVTFSSISGSYNHLLILGQAHSTTAANNTSLRAQFNSDTASNYNTTMVEQNRETATTSMNAGILVAASGAAAPYASPVDLFVPNYANTTFNKNLASRSGWMVNSGSIGYAEVTSGIWVSTAAITAIKLFPSAGNFDVGTRFTLYGLI